MASASTSWVSSAGGGLAGARRVTRRAVGALVFFLTYLVAQVSFYLEKAKSTSKQHTCRAESLVARIAPRGCGSASTADLDWRHI